MTTRAQLVKRKLGGKPYTATWKMIGVVDGEPVSAADDVAGVIDIRVAEGIEPKGFHTFFDTVSATLRPIGVDVIPRVSGVTPNLADSTFDPGFVEVTYRIEVEWWDKFKALPSEAKELACHVSRSWRRSTCLPCTSSSA